MGMEIKDERGRLLYSTDPAANPVPPKNSINLRERDVPMIALKKFRPPGGAGNCWPGDTFNLLPAEVDHFERNGLAKRKPKEVAQPEPEEIEGREEEMDGEPAEGEQISGETVGENGEPGPTLAKVEIRPSKRKYTKRR